MEQPTNTRLEILLKTYEYTQHWITLADTKAGLVLTINGVLTGFMVQQMVLWKKAYGDPKVAQWVVITGICLLTAYFVSQIISFLCTIQVFFPRSIRRDYQSSGHIFSVGIANRFPNPQDGEKFWQECREMEVVDYMREYTYQLHTDAIICSRKYRSLRLAIKTMLLAVSFAFATFVANGIFLQ